MSVSLFQINIWLQKKLINKEHFVYIASRTHEKSIVKRNLFRNILGVIMRFFTFGILKISGEGLASLGYPDNYIKEAMDEGKLY